MSDNWQTIGHLGPEIILIVAATWIFVVGAFARMRQWWPIYGAVSYGVAGLVLFMTDTTLSEPYVRQISGPLVLDEMAYHLRWLALTAGVLFTLLAVDPRRQQLVSEVVGAVMLVVVGVMLAARANELVFLFLSLELVSIPTYVLLFLGRKDRSGAESAVKYFFLSIFASALFLYGLSFLYGAGQTTTLAGAEHSIRQTLLRLASDGASEDELMSLWTARWGLVLTFAGLAFKIAAAPFHFYAPDVYEGATNPNAGLLAIAPKIAGITALVRISIAALPAIAEFGWQIAMVMALLTMTIGNVCALWQTNLRRLMAYSSIAHAGYMLLGLTVGIAATPEQTPFGGVAAVMFYLLTYVLASLAFFAILTYLGGPRRELNQVDELSGLSRSHPGWAAAIAICMFSLAGIPPLAGFWGKLTLLFSAVGVVFSEPHAQYSGWFALLLIAGVINAAIAAAYYLRVIGVMYFGAQDERPSAQGGWMAWYAAIVALYLLIRVSITPGVATESAQSADNSLREAASSGVLGLSRVELPSPATSQRR